MTGSSGGGDDDGGGGKPKCHPKRGCPTSQPVLVSNITSAMEVVAEATFLDVATYDQRPLVEPSHLSNIDATVTEAAFVDGSSATWLDVAARDVVDSTNSRVASLQQFESNESSDHPFETLADYLWSLDDDELTFT